MRELRDLAHTPRWGIARVIRRQSVAEHSFFVTAYAGVICNVIGISAEAGFRIMRMATFHDVAEQFTSDIPGPVKRALINPKDMKEYEALGMKERYGDYAPDLIDAYEIDIAVIKLADLIDECCYLQGEMRLGNTELQNLWKSSTSRLDEALARVLHNPLLNVIKQRHLRHFVNTCINSEQVGTSLDPSAAPKMVSSTL